MRNIILISFFTAVTFFTACNDIYRNFQSVKDLKWYKKDIKTFNVSIPEDGNYDLLFALRHSFGYPFTSIKINIEQITPEGKVLEKNAEFRLIDKNGKYLGEVTGQLWDTENVFSENTFLQKGKYIFKIKHIMNNNPVILVIDVGLIVRKHKEN